MNTTRASIAIILLLVLAAPGCDKGLAPLNDDSGIGGVIRFKNWPGPNWPGPGPAPLVYELRLVAFTTFPRDSADILLSLASGKAVIYPPIGVTGFPKGQDTLHYEWLTKGGNLQLRSYEYLVMAWRYGPNPFADWRPVGVYTQNPGSFDPATVRVLLHRITDVSFVCDFANPPPKPWK